MSKNKTSHDVADDECAYKTKELSWSSEDEVSLEELLTSNKTTSSASTPKNVTSKKSKKKKTITSPSSAAVKETNTPFRRSTRRRSAAGISTPTTLTAAVSNAAVSNPAQENDDEPQRAMSSASLADPDSSINKEEVKEKDEDSLRELDDQINPATEQDAKPESGQEIQPVEVVRTDDGSTNEPMDQTREGDEEIDHQPSSKDFIKASPGNQNVALQLDDDVTVDEIAKTTTSNEMGSGNEQLLNEERLAVTVVGAGDEDDSTIQDVEVTSKGLDVVQAVGIESVAPPEPDEGTTDLAIQDNQVALPHDDDEAGGASETSILMTEEATPILDANKSTADESNEPPLAESKAAAAELPMDEDGIEQQGIQRDNETETSLIDSTMDAVATTSVETQSHDDEKVASTAEAATQPDPVSKEENQVVQTVINMDSTVDEEFVIDVDKNDADNDLAMQVDNENDPHQDQQVESNKGDDPTQAKSTNIDETNAVVDLVTSESESERTLRHESMDLVEDSQQQEKPTKPVDMPSPMVVVVESEDDEEVYAAFTCKRKRPVSSRSFHKKKAKKIKVIVNSVKASEMEVDYSTGIDENPDRVFGDDGSDRGGFALASAEYDDEWFDNDEDLETAMSFFGETHEDQDPIYIEFMKAKEAKEIRDEMAKLDEEDMAGRKAIEEIVTYQLKAKQANADRNLDKYREKASEEEQRDLRRLQERYNETSASNQTKVSHGLKILRQSHTQEIQKALQQHHQNVNQRRLPEQIGNAEWGVTSQQLQAKHQRQMQEFHAKGEEMKKRCDAEYKREQDKIRQQREKRHRDIDAGRQKVFSKLLTNFQQLRQRHLKRHMQKMIKKKEEILRKVSKQYGVGKNRKEAASPAPRDAVQEAMDATLELRAPSPIKSTPEWVDHSAGTTSGAAARHKHRKGVLGQINKQLSVELHNEGIWIYSKLPDEKGEADKGDGAKKGTSDDVDGSRDDEFIPWGLKARTIIQSIICGEIPIGYGADRFNLGDAVAAQGGHIRCVVTDLRTSEDTASKQRATAIREQEEASLSDLEAKSAKLSTLSMDSEKNSMRADADVKECMNSVETAGKDVEKSRKALQDFQTKCRDYISPGRLLRLSLSFCANVTESFKIWAFACFLLLQKGSS
jgi:hypothetical protein